MKIAAGKHCRGCGVALQRHTGGEQCPVCEAYDAGHMMFREGMCFYVTQAAGTHLEAWLAGVWIPSRIVEPHATFSAARDAVAQLNQGAREEWAEQGRFYFVSTNPTSTARHS